jgi:hypothetical protein
LITKRILILGGYGNFGKRIAFALSKAGLPIIIAGRDLKKATDLAANIKHHYPDSMIETARVDVRAQWAESLRKLSPYVVINTCGPFQLHDYSVAKACIAQNVHYLDLADGRDFVVGMDRLDLQAKEHNVLVVSGASTVPGLSSAVLDAYCHEFSVIESLKFGISPGQKAERGLATTQAILTYIGKPLRPFAGHHNACGWQDLYCQRYPELGLRWMANCDIPDLDLLPSHYGIQSIQFSAGMESWSLHFTIWALSWCVRLGLPFSLSVYAKILLKMSHIFDFLGTDNGGMHMIMNGKNKLGEPHMRQWFIIAKEGDGPHIPTIPSIILAKKLISGEEERRGAMPCLGLVSLAEYKAELAGLAIQDYYF